MDSHSMRKQRSLRTLPSLPCVCLKKREADYSRDARAVAAHYARCENIIRLSAEPVLSQIGLVVDCGEKNSSN